MRCIYWTSSCPSLLNRMTSFLLWRISFLKLCSQNRVFCFNCFAFVFLWKDSVFFWDISKFIDIVFFANQVKLLFWDTCFGRSKSKLFAVFSQIYTFHKCIFHFYLCWLFMIAFSTNTLLSLLWLTK